MVFNDFRNLSQIFLVTLCMTTSKCISKSKIYNLVYSLVYPSRYENCTYKIEKCKRIMFNSSEPVIDSGCVKIMSMQIE